jgi:ERCC4-type nuclease
MMEIIIDHRETKLKLWIEQISKESQESWNIRFENLQLGDISIMYNGKTCYLFERKTGADLAASIKDKRYHEQKQRLKECNNKGVCICYIMEDLGGFPNYNNNISIGGIKGDTIQSAIISNILCDRNLTFITNNFNETSILLREIFTRMINRPERYFKDQDNNTESGMDVNLLVHKKKNSQITKGNILILMLSQIPTISVKIGECIANNHSTMYDLMTILNEYNNTEERIKYISGLGYPMKNNKIRRVGPKAAEKVVNFLY